MSTERTFPRRALLRAGTAAGAAGMAVTLRSRAAMAAQASGAVSLRPLGTGQDDWPAVAAAAAQNAYSAPIILEAGVWYCSSQQALPNGTTIIGTPKTRIVQTLPSGTGDPTVAAFAAQYVSNPSLKTAVTAAPSAGSNQISVLSNVLPVGSYFLVQEQASAYRLRIYRVVAVSPGGPPYVLTVDRAINAGLSFNDQIVGVTPASDIEILGNGMSMSGTGSRYIELMGSSNCVVADVNFDSQSGSVSERLISLDIASCNSHIVHLTGDGGGVTPLGISFESADSCSAVACTLSGCSTAAYIFEDAQNCRLVDCQTTQNPAEGVIFTGTNGSQGCAVIGGIFTGNVHGMVIEAGSSLAQILSVTISGNSGDGIAIEGTAPVSNTLITGSFISQNGQSGVEIASCGLGTIVTNSSVTGNQKGVAILPGATTSALRNVDLSCNGIGLDVGSTCDADLLTGNASTTSLAIVVIRSNASLRARGLTFTSPATINGILAEDGAQADIDGLALSLGGASNGVTANGAGADLHVQNATIAASGGGIGLYASAGTIRVGAGVDASACATPLYCQTGGYLSLGNVTANGLQPVSVPWPSLDAGDMISLTMVSSRGTPAGLPAIAMTPGIGFSITASPGDTSVYMYRVFSD